MGVRWEPAGGMVILLMATELKDRSPRTSGKRLTELPSRIDDLPQRNDLGGM